MWDAESSGRDERNISFTVSWTIENFRFVDVREEAYLESPVFDVDSMKRTQWYLKLYPNNEGTEKVGVYIYRSKDDYDASVYLIYNIKILKAGNVLAEDDTESQLYEYRDPIGYGSPSLLELNKIIQEKTESRFEDDDLLIQVEMWTAEKDLKVVENNPGDYFHFESLGKNLDLFYNFPSQTDDVMEDIDQIERKLVQHSNKCSIGTIINVKEAELDWTVERFSTLQKNKKKIAVIKPAFSESFAVLILYLNDDDIIQIEVLMNKTLSGYESMHCHLSVCDIDNMIERSCQQIFYFESNTICTNLSFPDVIKKSDVLAAKEKLLDRDALNLHFVFTFVVGTSTTHTIYATSPRSKVLQPDAQQNRLSRQMEDIFVSRQHCDVTLRAGSQDISCHKAIACHMSPVLAAMFTADMQEKNTGVVHVTDVDADTLNTLLRYMYTGGVNDIGVQEYMKLYVASDKYQVSSLTRDCRKRIGENLSVDNVCDVLLCADAHSDVTLKKCSMDFVRSNVSRVFSSDEWKTIAEVNPKLASEVILFVTTKLQKR